MDTIILRTLTEKSTLGVGKLGYLKVGELMKLEKHPYLRRIYYTYSGISFCAEVLRKIGIPEDYLIAKPGINPELCDKLNEEKQSKIGFFERQHIRKRKKGNKIEYLGFVRATNTFSKRELQAINHNKF